jgi:hypothetical protein
MRYAKLIEAFTIHNSQFKGGWWNSPIDKLRARYSPFTIKTFTIKRRGASANYHIS